MTLTKTVRPHHKHMNLADIDLLYGARNMQLIVAFDGEWRCHRYFSCLPVKLVGRGIASRGILYTVILILQSRLQRCGVP